MSRCPFPDCIVPKLHQFLGNLFYRGQKIDVLELADWQTLAYWSDWHDILSDAELSPDNKKGSKKKKVIGNKK